MDGLPGDETPARRAQQLHYGGDILRIAVMADQRMAAARDDAALAGGRRTRPADAPGHHAIHRNAVAAEFDRKRLGEPDETGFRGRDMGPPGGAGVACDAADVDDGAVPLGQHARNDGAAAQKRAVKHHRHDETPVRKAHGGEDIVAPDGGIVDQDVDRAERAADLRDHAGDLGLVGYIAHDDACGAAERLDLPHGIGRLIARGFRIHRNGGAFARQRQRNGTADPPHAAGDERHLSGEFTLGHRKHPLSQPSHVYSERFQNSLQRREAFYDVYAHQRGNDHQDKIKDCHKHVIPSGTMSNLP